MLKMLTVILIAICIFASLGFSNTERPILVTCGEALPENVHYSLSMHSDWNTREQPTASHVSITLINELTGEAPEEIPESLQPFVNCAKSSVGL